MRFARFGLALLLLVAGACGGEVADARAQWTVHVRTDAPVPQLGDRVLVELLRSDGTIACAGCRRLFGLIGPDAWPFSFGIPDPGNESLRLRVRLFRSDRSDVGGGPKDGVPIDVLGDLPPTRGGAIDVTAVLELVCAGIGADVAGGRTCDAASGGLAPRTLPEGDGANGPSPGASPLAEEVPCPRAPSAGMVCIPGGLFVRGDSAMSLEQDAAYRAVPERLARVSPFAIDENEMTVGTFRALVASGFGRRPAVNAGKGCTWSDVAAGQEDLPLNCIARDDAAAACEARGLRLPTEAEWEFAAGARTEERRYPWGADPDACSHAIVGKGRLPNEGGLDNSNVCRKETSPGIYESAGPRPVTMPTLDVTPQGVRHLGGSMSEWVLDAANVYDPGVCDDGARVLVDPLCRTAAAPNAFLSRGGDWADPPLLALSALRHIQRTSDGLSTVGFRCVDAMR